MPRRCSFKLEIGFPQPLAGVDEAGCAPLAGPVVAAACILDRDKFPRGIDDSKNLPLEKRESLYARITKVAAYGVGVATVEEIDSINIYWARMLAMTRAVEALGVEPAWRELGPTPLHRRSFGLVLDMIAAAAQPELQLAEIPVASPLSHTTIG